MLIASRYLAIVRRATGMPSAERSSAMRPSLKGASGSDRKSTRLNSSHRCISYAVFCLKKKKKRETPTDAMPHNQLAHSSAGPGVDQASRPEAQLYLTLEPHSSY